MRSENVRLQARCTWEHDCMIETKNRRKHIQLERRLLLANNELHMF